MKLRSICPWAFSAILLWVAIKLLSLSFFTDRKSTPASMPVKRHFDLLTATAADLRTLFESGELSSVELVKIYLKQISRHNHQGMKLNAMISTAPEDLVIEEAKALDAERSKTGPRSPLHGIPIILKDLICTERSLGMATTSGSFALKGFMAKNDASITALLRKAGCLIIGKSNLSEWANGRGFSITSGWSALGGQTQSPYVRGGVDPTDKWMGHSTPGGSSSGSAVAAAVGFTPLSIGTEVDGSIVQPAIRAALYSLKGTVGDINASGTQSGGAAFDSAGPLAKSVLDCADVMDILLPGRNFRSHLSGSWKGISIAYLNYEKWQFDESVSNKVPEFDEQHKREMEGALVQAESLGAKVVHDAPLLDADEVVEKYKTVEMGQILRHQLQHTMKRYLENFDEPGMRTLEDVVKFNKEHASVELPPEQPGQQILENGLKDNMTKEEYDNGLKHLRASMRDAIEKCLEETKAEFIMASGESGLTTVAAIAGYPIASVPLGFSTFNGRPFGMEIVARKGQEGRIFELMSAWEATFPEARKPPPLLVNWSSNL